ncbi:MAG: protein-L-isoaspartate(D-aspartate) O-methyltransferase [Deltaproteobacteria bacterium]|nr:protein-L-isoaspartate(D-aspartate) O-methyltransferase [Deltaproteobacteria bacterium]
MTASSSSNQQKGSYSIARKRMIQEQIVDRGVRDQAVLAAMQKIHRHDFVDDALKAQAYRDAPLNIGEGQTISQPYIVALMTQSLKTNKDHKVLEIGTGCGFQTSILSELAGKVYTIERIRGLGLQARKRFKDYGLRNIVMRVGDGSKGWEEAAPFDRIIVTCASPKVPERLLEQLNIGGVMVVPVSQKEGHQNLLRITKTKEGLKTENLGECHFVKLIGRHGYRQDREIKRKDSLA